MVPNVVVDDNVSGGERGGRGRGRGRGRGHGRYQGQGRGDVNGAVDGVLVLNVVGKRGNDDNVIGRDRGKDVEGGEDEVQEEELSHPYQTPIHRT